MQRILKPVMKQPELGNKISELRQSKGLTQTELAESCNLSLRTIQRIEAAEVIPRAYTIKQIFEALGHERVFEKLFSKTRKTPLIKKTGSLINVRQF